jgi:hypothetical protein
VELRRTSGSTIFTIQAISDDTDTISQSGVLTAGTYTLHALADSYHGDIGQFPLSTKGSEFEFGLALDVVAPGEIVNGRMMLASPSNGDIFQWESSGPGSVEIIEVGEEGEDLVAEYETSQYVGITQDIDTFAQTFVLNFDYRFLDTEGVLQVKLGGDEIFSLGVPSEPSTDLQTASVVISAPELLGQTDIPLEFSFLVPDGLTLSQLHLDNVSIRRAADLNNDGFVDGGDLDIWALGYAATSAGDIDGDGDSDGRDFLIWQRQFNGSVASVSAATFVPEPSAGILLFLVASGTVFGRAKCASTTREHQRSAVFLA